MASFRPARRLTGLAAATVLSAATLTAPGATPALAAIGGCATDAIIGEGAFYPGPSASRVYDATFARGPAIPHLSTHTSQGLTVWQNWDGKKRGNDLLLLGQYRDGRPSYLVGIDPDTGKRKGTVRVAESHLGALGVVGTWLVTGDDNSRKVRVHKISDLRRAMKKAARSGKKPKVAHVGKAQRKPVYDFMSSYRGRAWIGDFSGDPASAEMRQYKINKKGKLRQVGKPWQVPTNTQGVLVTEDRFVFVSGLSAGTMTVVERGERRLINASGRCFASPSHGQNIVVYGAKVFLAFEGGAAKYATKPTTRNRIAHLHVANYDTLGALMHPVP